MYNLSQCVAVLGLLVLVDFKVAGWSGGSGRMASSWSSDSSNLWHNGFVDYYVHESFSSLEKDQIKNALDYISSELQGCIKFNELRRKPNMGRSFLEINSGISCGSEIGKQRGRSTKVDLNPDAGCLARGKILLR